ncbi:MAG: Hsp20 family protein [Candidatus Hodarchaeota archaeon]
MVFDSFDKYFKKMMKRFNNFFTDDFMDPFSEFRPLDEGETKEGAEDVPEVGFKSPEVESKSFGYEIISGSNMKEPVIRIHGDPNAFPGMKERLEKFLHAKLDDFLPAGDDETVIEQLPEAPRDDGIEEPYSDTYTSPDGTVTINVDLPGISEEEFKVESRDGAIRLEAYNGFRHYAKKIPVGFTVPQESIETRIHNGLLEIKVKKEETAVDKEETDKE